MSPGPGAGLQLAGDSDVWPAGDQNQCLGKAGGLRAVRGVWSLDTVGSTDLVHQCVTNGFVQGTATSRAAGRTPSKCKAG